MSDHDPRADRHPAASNEDSYASDDTEPNEGHVPRARTAVRIGLSLVFFLVVRIAETVLAAVILFELIYTLVTERPPSHEIRRFANRVLSYLVTIARYLTYESDCPPFPFSDLPPELTYTPKNPTPA
jgi:hypothetical protein